VYNILGCDIVKCAETEAGLEAAYKAVCESTNTHSTEDLLRIIRAADREFLQELRDNGEDLEESEKLLLLSEDDDLEEQKVGDDTVGKEQENASDSDKDGDPDINEEQNVDDDDMEKDEENEQNVDDDMEKDAEMGQNVDSDDMENDQEKASDSQEEVKSDPNEKHKVDDGNDKDVDKENASESNGNGDTDPTDNKYGDSPTRGSIRSQVFKSSVAQAKQVNSRRNKFSREVLSVGDICNVEIEGKIRGAEGPKYLPVAVMEV
jgi:hypothetical protein